MSPRHKEPYIAPLPWHRRISVRTALLSAAVSALSLLLFVIATFPFSRGLMRDHLRSRAALIGATLAEEARDSRLQTDTAHVNKACEEMIKSDPDLLFIAFVDAAGATTMHRSGGVTNLTLAAPWRAVAQAGATEGRDPVTDAPAFCYSAPLDLPGGGRGALHVGLSLQDYNTGLARLWQFFLLIGLLCVAFALLASLFYARHLVHPLRALRSVVMQVAEGRLEARANVIGRDEVGELSRTLNTMIEHLQQTQGELSKAKEEAVAASDAKSRFLATVSHEIRTPINGVIGMLKLLKDSPLDGQQVRQVDTAIASARALLSVIEGILDFSKIEAGKIEVESIDYDLARAVDSAVTIFGERAREKKLELKKRIAPNVPPRLKGDPNRITQVLINLLGNAFKFTERGSVGVNVQIAEVDGQRRVRFEVADTGVGVSPAQQERLFQPFTQADSSTTRKYGGTGLGLAICKQLVELMGGTIGLSSAEGVGTVFSFTLPLVEGAPAPVETPLASTPTPTIDSLNPKAAILVVEDNNINAYVTRELLIRNGYTADVAVNGQDALRACAVNDYDLILMDIQMPIMDGYEATRAIRELERHRPEQRMPIVALTANALAGERERCLAAGMDDYLAKPLDPEQMNRTIERLLRPDRKRAKAQLGREAVNYQELLERCMKDETLTHQLLTEFVVQARDTVDELKQHLAANDRQNFRMVAHRLKGTAATMAAPHVRRVSFQLESMANEPDLPERAAPLFVELAQHVQDVASWFEIRKGKDLL